MAALDRINGKRSILHDIPGGDTPMARHERVFLFVLVVLSLVIHRVFMFEGFGEYDAASLATNAVSYYYKPLLYSINRIIPLYQLVVVKCLDFGVDKAAIPVLMNYTNFILASLALIPLYMIWRKISSSQVAGMACILYSFVPAYWFAHLYGMPHLPAFFFLLWSAVFFLKTLNGTHSARFFYYVLAIGMMFLSLTCKVDVILYSGLFIGLVVARDAWTKQNIVGAFLVPLSAIGLTLIFIKSFCLKQEVVSGNFIAEWHKHWPTDITALKSPIPVWSVGAVFFAGILFSGLYGLFKPSLRRYVVLSIAWAMPAACFWCLRWGNSTRHMMIVFSVLIFLLSLAMVHLCSSRRLLYSVAIIGILLNYFLMPVGKRDVNSGGRLIETTQNAREHNNQIKQNGIALAATPYNDIVLVGGYSLPFLFWEQLVHHVLIDKKETKAFYIYLDKNTRTWNRRMATYSVVTLETSTGQRKIVRLLYVPSNTILLNDSASPYWTFQDGVTIVNDPNDTFGNVSPTP